MGPRRGPHGSGRRALGVAALAQPPGRHRTRRVQAGAVGAGPSGRIARAGDADHQRPQQGAPVRRRPGCRLQAAHGHPDLRLPNPLHDAGDGSRVRRVDPAHGASVPGTHRQALRDPGYVRRRDHSCRSAGHGFGESLLRLASRLCRRPVQHRPPSRSGGRGGRPADACLAAAVRCAGPDRRPRQRALEWGWIEDATGLPIAASIADALQRE